MCADNELYCWYCEQQHRLVEVRGNVGKYERPGCNGTLYKNMENEDAEQNPKAG